MKKEGANTRLVIVFTMVLFGTSLAFWFQKSSTELPFAGDMHEASELAGEWFDTIATIKITKDIQSDTYSNVPNRHMIGDDWSDITTTLGSLEAKEIATNPEFAALVFRWLIEAGIGEGDTVGVLLSGSFPSLSVSVLAALQTINAEAIVISSLGASTYGANQAQSTWLDMESWLRERAGLKYKSDVITMGAGQDNGQGMTEEGKILLGSAAVRNRQDLYIPESISESINFKTDLLLENNIMLLINIGGNMAALGACPHTLNIPNGLNNSFHTCSDSLRGIIPRVIEHNIPVIHLLNIKELAANYGMDIAPGTKYSKSLYLYNESRSGKLVFVIILLFSLGSVGILKRSGNTRIIKF